MRGAEDRIDPLLSGPEQHHPGHHHILCTVIHAGNQVHMDINHFSFRGS